MALQKRVLRIILGKNFKSNQLKLIIPLSIRQNYCLLSLLRHYDELGLRYKNYAINTRNKILSVPPFDKTIATKSSIIHYATVLFNQLPNSLKELDISKKT